MYINDKTDKMAGFIYGALELGYNYDDAWKLMLGSTAGRGILNNEYTYTVHFQGRASADKADAEIGDQFVKNSHELIDCDMLDNLAYNLEIAHNDLGIPYEHLFDKCPLSEYVTKRACFGEYDEKLIKAWLLRENAD